MPTARPIMKIMLGTKNDRGNACPTRDATPRATNMDTKASAMGTKATTTAPNTSGLACNQDHDHSAEHQYENHERYWDAEHLSSFDTLLANLLEVFTGRGLACNQDLETSFALGFVDNVHDLFDVVGGVIEVSSHGEGNYRGSSIFGDEKGRLSLVIACQCPLSDHPQLCPFHLQLS